MFSKFLKPVSLLFLIFIACELSFLWGINKSNSTLKVQDKPSFINTTPLPSARNSNFTKNSLSNEDVFARINQLINQRAIKSSVFTTEYRGSLIEMKDKDIQSPFQDTLYQPKLFLSLEALSGGKSRYGLYFNNNELSSLKLFGPNQQPISYQDLKVGTILTIRESWDLLKKGTMSYEIIIQ